MQLTEAAPYRRTVERDDKRYENGESLTTEEHDMVEEAHPVVVAHIPILLEILSRRTFMREPLIAESTRKPSLGPQSASLFASDSGQL